MERPLYDVRYVTSTHVHIPTSFPSNDALPWPASYVNNNNNNHKNKIYRKKRSSRSNDGGQFSCAAVMVTQLPGIISEYKI